MKKDITFIYMDSAEKSFMILLEKEAKKRGYKTKVTADKFARCEIGVYCQHVNFPQFSKFSVIMLHDIIQQYGNWPDIWFQEPWNKYDIGILPSNQWVENWNQCSKYYYARPRKGVYQVGWPKADGVANVNKEDYRHDFYKKYSLDLNKKTVLYAPAWENDGKQDDFIKAMEGLDVNILIKQWDADPKKFPQVVANIKEMYELHKNMDGVTILPPSTNIFNAIMAADILVSEESSTMSEAAMLGVPAVSVSNWLIPDVTPSRFPECNYDFVVMTKKEKLHECVKNMLADYGTFKATTEEYAKNNFSNIGKSCEMIMDIIDDAISGAPIRYEKLEAAANENISLRKKMKFVFICMKRELHENYCQRYWFLMKIWNTLRFFKRILCRQKVTA